MGRVASLVRSSASVLEGTTKETELDPAMTAPPSDDLIDRMKLDMHYLRKMHDVKDIALGQATAELADATALIAKLRASIALADARVANRPHDTIRAEYAAARRRGRWRWGSAAIAIAAVSAVLMAGMAWL